MSKIPNTDPLFPYLIVSWVADTLFGVILFIIFLSTIVKKTEFPKFSNKVKLKQKQFGYKRLYLTLISVILLAIFIPRIVSGYYFKSALAFSQQGDYKNAINAYRKAKDALNWTFYDISEKNSIDQKISDVNRAIPPKIEITPTPTRIPVSVKQIVPVDPDPIITCNIHASCGGGSRQIRQSECYNMICCLIDQKCGGPKQLTRTACDNSFCCFLNNGTGVLLASRTACDNYYSGSTKQNTINVPVSTFTPLPTFAPLPTFSTQIYATPTLTDSQAQSIIDQHNLQVQQCRSDVVNQYSSLIQGCNIRFGDSSAAEACVKIYSDDRQNAYNACGNTY